MTRRFPANAAGRFGAAALACAALAAALPPPAVAAAKEPGIFIYWKNDLDLIVKTQEAKRPRIEKVLPLLALKPGMTVLDIGAGTGQQSYLIAEALKGTGRVYATDTEPRLVDYVNAQARARGLKNLEAVRVTGDGLDGFYARHTFDLVLVYDMISFLHDRAGYFGRLRKSLAPGGRVVVVGQPDASFYPFVREDFSDWDGFLADLRREPPDTVFGRALAGPIREGLEAAPPQAAGERDRVVLFHLNRNLDGDLFTSFTDGLDLKKDAPFSSDERAYAAWVLRRLDLAGIPGRRDRDELRYIEIRDVVMLNKLALIQRYRRYLKHDGPHPYIPDGPEARWLARHSPLAREFETAGYRLLSKTDLVPFQEVLIYGASGPGGRR